MTHLERMRQGLIFNTLDKEIQELQKPYQQRLWEFNRLKPADVEKKSAYMKENFAECGEGCYIELPFRASWGGKHVHFGNEIYANFNLTLIDDGHIYVGDRVLFAPNVVVITASHPINPKLRRDAMQYNRDVHIDENVWIGTGTIIMPGVHIGKNSVIGAGSIVTHDIPEGVVAIGSPCRVLRQITEDDDKYYSHTEIIDWDNIY